MITVELQSSENGSDGTNLNTIVWMWNSKGHLIFIILKIYSCLMMTKELLLDSAKSAFITVINSQYKLKGLLNG